MTPFVVLVRTHEGRQQRIILAKDSTSAEEKARKFLAKAGLKVLAMGVYRLEWETIGVSKEI